MLEFTLLKKLRKIIYHAFPIRRDANMNLLDALSSYGHHSVIARSAVILRHCEECSNTPSLREA